MKAFQAFFIVLFLAGCASQQRDKGVDLDDAELKWLSNRDFVPAQEVPYRPTEDFFSPRVAPSDSITRETIARLSDSELRQVVRQSDDPIALAAAHCHRGDFNSAFAVLDEAHDSFKSHPGYWNQVGTCYLLRNEINTSLLYYNKSRGLDPNYAPAVNNIGVIFMLKGLEQKAFRAFEEASRMNSFSLTPSFNLAQLYLKYGFTAKAREILAGIHRTNQDDVEVLAGLATSFLLEGNYERAVSFYSRIPRGDHGAPYIGLNFSLALHNIGRVRDAESIFSQVGRNDLGAYQDYYFQVEAKIRGR